MKMVKFSSKVPVEEFRSVISLVEVPELLRLLFLRLQNHHCHHLLHHLLLTEA